MVPTYTPPPEIQEQETPITRTRKAWRSILPVDSAVEIIPKYAEEQLINLGRWPDGMLHTSFNTTALAIFFQRCFQPRVMQTL
jgi:hypothetical protein